MNSIGSSTETRRAKLVKKCLTHLTLSLSYLVYNPQCKQALLSVILIILFHEETCVRSLVIKTALFLQDKDSCMYLIPLPELHP